MAHFSNAQLYGPCFCGSGKKLKFCCAALPLVRHADDDTCDRCGKLVEQGRYAEARDLLDPMLARGTTNPRAYNARALIAFQEGDDERALALADEVWTRLAPGNAYSGALLAHGLAARGEMARANAVADRLREVPIIDPTHTHQVVTALGALGRDEDIVNVVARGPAPHGPLVETAFAVALVNLGRLDEAGPALRRALSSAPYATWLRQILAEVERGRMPATPFGRLAVLPLAAWLPGGNAQELIMNAAAHTERTRKLVRRYPLLIEAYKQMTWVDGSARLAGLDQLGRAGAREELLTFARGTFGSDDERFAAGRALVEHGIVGQNEPLRMRVRGKVLEVRIRGRGIEASDDRLAVFAIPQSLEQEYARTVELHRAGKNKEAGRAIRALLTQAPNHPIFRYNELAWRLGASKHADPKGIEELSALIAEFPDYLFARATLATVLVVAKRLDDAEAVLTPDHIAQSIHPEWLPVAMVARARVELAQDRLDAATALIQSAEKVGFDVARHAPELAMLSGLGRVFEEARARLEAKEEKARRRHVDMNASTEEWFAHLNVAQLKGLAHRIGVRGPTRRADLLSSLDLVLSDRPVVEHLLGRLSEGARRAWDALQDGGGRLDQEPFTREHGEHLGELGEVGLAVAAAVDGRPSVAIPAPVRAALGQLSPADASTADAQWVVGVVALPEARIAGEHAAPIVALVMDQHGMVLEQAVGMPEERRELVAMVLGKASKRGLPARVSVADPELKRLVTRAGIADAAIVVERSSVLDKVGRELALVLGGPRSYLECGASPSAVRGMFEAVADLYVAAPWKAVPDDCCLFRIQAQGRKEVVACVIGQAGDEYGIVIFDSVVAHRRWRECSDRAMEHQEVRWAPTAVSVTFEPKRELPLPLQEEIRSHGWRVAGPAAFPMVIRTGGTLTPEPLELEDFAKLELAAHAVVAGLQAKKSSWRRREERQLQLATPSGPVTVCVELIRVD